MKHKPSFRAKNEILKENEMLRVEVLYLKNELALLREHRYENKRRMRKPLMTDYYHSAIGLSKLKNDDVEITFYEACKIVYKSNEQAISKLFKNNDTDPSFTQFYDNARKYYQERGRGKGFEFISLI